MASDQQTLLTPSLKSGSATSPPSHVDTNQYIASFDVGSVHQKEKTPIAVTTPTPATKTSTAKPKTTTTTHSPNIVTSSGTTTTTKNPFVHIYETSSSRPATISHGQNHYIDNHNQPESHRIPIINNNKYPHHDYLPRPIGEGSSSTSSPNYPYGSTTYDIFNEKTVAPPLSSYEISSGALYRGNGGHAHMSGSHNAYEYDSRPITPSSNSYHDRYGHHNYHPSSSGFPGPITESSRYPSTGSSYDIYKYNQARNELYSNGGSYHHNHPHMHSDSSSFSRIPDPMGKYDNCRLVNGIVLCAENANTNHHSHYIPGRDRGDIMGTTNYGLHSSRDRDEYSTYYPNRYSTTSSSRPMLDYHFSNRQGYPNHGPRQPIELDMMPTSSYPSYVPKEQRISSQSILPISSSSTSSMSSTTIRNDNDNPLCRSMCGVNSICRLVLDRPVCGCPEGHTGDPSVRCTPVYSTSAGNTGGGHQCERHVDCMEYEICAKNKCIDPCKEQEGMSSASVIISGDYHNNNGRHDGSSGYKGSICGTNASCLVVGHTPVCKCNQGYFGNPYVACVP